MLFDPIGAQNPVRVQGAFVSDSEVESVTSYIHNETAVKEMLSSEELAGKIQKLGVEGKGHLVFVIGGSLGLSKEVMDRADYALSFSKMTFPHQLMRVILLEQIYRGFKIIAGEPYHK